MADMKTLAKDTAIYGLSSIIGRFLNYLLVPLYTYKIAAASGGYGVITPARSPLYLQDRGGQRRLRGHHEPVRLHRPPPGHPDLRHGDDLLPLREQGGRGPEAGVLLHPPDGRPHLARVHRPGVRLHRPDLLGDGLSRASVLHLVARHRGGPGRLPGHPVLLPAVPESRPSCSPTCGTRSGRSSSRR